MTIFELLTTRPPYDDIPQRDANTLHRLVREGRRPLLTEKVNDYDDIVTVQLTILIAGGPVTSSNTRCDGDVLGS